MEPTLILKRWAKHFGKVWNQPSHINDTAIEDIHPVPEMSHLDVLATLDEIRSVMKPLNTGKVSGADGIPPEVYKLGGPPSAFVTT